MSNKKTAKELVEDLTDFVNVFGCDREGFKNAFRRQHRTLQQSTIRLFLELMEDVAREDFPTDGRNEQAKEVCQDIITGFLQVQEQKTGRSHSSFKPSQFLGCI